MERLQCEEQMFLTADWKPTPAHSPLSQSRMDFGGAASPATPYSAHITHSPDQSTDSSADVGISFPVDMTYTNLASNMEQASVTMPTFGVNGLCWSDKQPCTWSEDDVIIWLAHLNQKPQLPSRSTNKDLEIEAFIRKTGADLVQMRCDEFIKCDPPNGMFIYMALQEQVGIQKTPSNPIDLTRSHLHRPDESMTSLARSLLNLDDSIRRNGTQFDIRAAHTNTHITAESSNHLKLGSLDLRLISFDNNDNFNSIRSLKNDSDGTASVSAMPMPENLSHQRSTKPDTDRFNKISTTQPPQPKTLVLKPTVQDSTKFTPMPMIIDTRLGRAQPLTIISSPLQEVRGNHLWEFIRDLLLDTRYNPSIIKWEDRAKGIFRLIKSDSVAKLWGERKKNPAMTYEKLSRAMRYYYQRKILERIDGKRLVYKFGPMATGWKG